MRRALIALVLAACGSEHSPATPPATLAAFAPQITALLARHHVPGAAIARVRGDAIETAAFGDVAPDTVFQAASLTKPLFARTVLLSGVPVDATARQLLLHAATGRWAYSGPGYVQLQRYVEQATHEPLDRLANRLVLEPLHLAHTTLVTPPGALATGHGKDGQPTATQRWPEPLASSSLHTTAADYAAFVRSLFGAPLDTMLATTVPVGENDLQWSLGWAIETWRGDRWFFHWGANPGFRSFVLGSNARREAIVILTDGDNGLDLAEDLVELVRGERHPLFQFRMLHPE